MKSPSNHQIPGVDEIIHRVGVRAENLFNTRQLWCAGAVLVVLNRAFRGELTRSQAIRLTAGMGEGLGAGCLCGGLNGAALAIGLFLGSGRFSSRGDRGVQQATVGLHDQFKQVHGSTCCRVLLKKDKENSKKQFQACAGRTATAAELGAALILEQRPELIQTVDWPYLNEKEGLLTARVKIVADNLKN